MHETCWKYVKSAHSILNHLQIRISFDQHHASAIKKYGKKLKKIFFIPSSFAHSAQNEKQAEKPSQHHLTRKNVPMKKVFAQFARDIFAQFSITSSHTDNPSRHFHSHRHNQHSAVFCCFLNSIFLALVNNNSKII